MVAYWAVLFSVTLMPVVAGAWHRQQQGWYPESDEATIVLLSDDVLRGDPPLVGMISTGGAHLSDPELHHPGPLELYLISPFSRILGPDVGSAMAGAVVSAVSIGCLVAGLRSIGGRHLAAAGFVTSALILWGIGADAPTSVWNPYVVVLPFACFLVLAVAAVVGRPWTLVGFVAFGSLVAQTHLSYAGLVGSLVLWVGGMTAWRLVRHRAAHGSWPDGRLRQAGLAAAVGAVLWLPPLVDQVRGHPGNLGQIWRSFSGPSGESVGAPALGELSRVVGVPLVGLRPRDELIRVLPNIGVVDLIPVVLLVSLLIGIVVTGFVRGPETGRDGAALAAGSTMLVAVAAGSLTAVRIPLSDGVQYQYYGLWMWPLGAIVWTFAVWSSWRLVPGALRSSNRTAAVGRWVPALLIPTVLVASATPRPSAWEPWVAYRRTAGAVAPAAAAGDLGAGPVLVRFRGATPYLSTGSAVVLSLAADGHEIVIDPGAPTPVFPWRDVRRYVDQEVTAEVWVVAGASEADVPEGAELLARTRILEPREVAGVQERLNETSRTAAGSVRRGPRSARDEEESRLVDSAIADPGTALAHGGLADLAARGLVVVDGIEADELFTLERMRSLSVEEHVSVYLIRSQRR